MSDMIIILFCTAVPFSVVSMAITQALVAKGNTIYYVAESANYLYKINIYTL